MIYPQSKKFFETILKTWHFFEQETPFKRNLKNTFYSILENTQFISILHFDLTDLTKIYNFSRL